MQRIVLSSSVIVLVFLFFGFSKFFATASATNSSLESTSRVDTFPPKEPKTIENISVTFENHIKTMYQKLKLKKAELEYTPFRTAYIGYLNLEAKDKLKKEILTILDFTKSSLFERMWIIDIKNRKLIRRELVAHGKNSGHDMVTSFSNKLHSNQSSMGFYVTDAPYIGSNGISLLINGMDKGYNDQARNRSVVMHGADYVNPKTMNRNGRLGRSFGCPAVEKAKAKEIINYVKNGSCLFIYFKDTNYLASSKWINLDKATTFFAENIQHNAVNVPSTASVTTENTKG
ncbi:Ykud domain-containing protein [Bernardetia litoralis DSM 6794]|uniref:Ykud domain-containing protein n=1 Tax=Bernardetia litoralis (strain ATCC 23117 / DSM 6794 / NBRC 15988 / NCIMB 1366 / Fx l1 / Sio-4) TaxID=880071 RepID=I4AGN7_BERLS|nr:murein L,D-transpeptidase catalytic domain family protein [Bernardetia litoralis]AFM03122.1 Ykud domain-containing protein [Bernardetia litoralis DSM 6794]